MIHEASAMAVRKSLGELLNGVQYRHDAVLITKAGKPIAALVDIDFFEKAKKMKEQFEYLSAELGKTYKKTEADVAAKEIKEAITHVRKKHKEK